MCEFASFKSLFSTPFIIQRRKQKKKGSIINSTKNRLLFTVIMMMVILLLLTSSYCSLYFSLRLFAGHIFYAQLSVHIENTEMIYQTYLFVQYIFIILILPLFLTASYFLSRKPNQVKRKITTRHDCCYLSACSLHSQVVLLVRWYIDNGAKIAILFFRRKLHVIFMSN